MLDFKELSKDGQAFEQLVREIIFERGIHVQWSGKGPDGGRDLVATERLAGIFSNEKKKWLIQCKHFAHAERSVGIGDLDDIVDSCTQHGATGYLLACSTQPSSAVVERLEAINKNPANQISTAYWDAVKIERLISNADNWAVAQHFFPESSEPWKIFATDSPNDFVAHHRGYIFHLSNRVGSRVEYHLESVDARLDDLEALEFPHGHFIRPRAVWYDDKNGGYSWYLDYMFPHDQQPVMTKQTLANNLGDGYALEDGQVHNFDISLIKYHPFSDHYDKDHYDYYLRYMPNYLSGTKRERESYGHEYFATRQEIERLEEDRQSRRSDMFDSLRQALDKIDYVRVMNAWNADVEVLHKFSRRRVWSDLISEINWSDGAFFTAKYRLYISNINEFIELLKKVPIDLGGMFNFSKEYICAPEGDIDDSDPIYTLTISVSPAHVDNELEIREALNSYFSEIIDIIHAQLAN